MSVAVEMGAVVVTTTTGNVTSGNKAYLRLPNARIPATITPIQNPITIRG